MFIARESHGAETCSQTGGVGCGCCDLVLGWAWELSIFSRRLLRMTQPCPWLWQIPSLVGKISQTQMEEGTQQGKQWGFCFSEVCFSVEVTCSMHTREPGCGCLSPFLGETAAGTHKKGMIKERHFGKIGRAWAIARLAHSLPWERWCKIKKL